MLEEASGDRSRTSPSGRPILRTRALRRRRGPEAPRERPEPRPYPVDGRLRWERRERRDAAALKLRLAVPARAAAHRAPRGVARRRPDALLVAALVPVVARARGGAAGQGPHHVALADGTGPPPRREPGCSAIVS